MFSMLSMPHIRVNFSMLSMPHLRVNFSMLSKLKDDAEIVIAISAQDIAKNKVRADYGITYDKDVIRLIDIC